ncbi:MAG: hypothetical protein JRH16_16145 [Deltaproteobacteria bacterium]|nr:hypothetical protein [Deltaproteobacteria bacterium]MBW2362120.1 hypothetical protein [Deltaproteobacteria bacterium]
MNDSSRTQGGLICVAVFILAAWFLVGLLQQSYWALALPVAAIVFFVLGLSFWVGYTIATIRVEPFDEPATPPPPSPPSPVSPDTADAKPPAGDVSGPQTSA